MIYSISLSRLFATFPLFNNIACVTRSVTSGKYQGNIREISPLLTSRAFLQPAQSRRARGGGTRVFQSAASIGILIGKARATDGKTASRWEGRVRGWRETKRERERALCRRAIKFPEITSRAKWDPRFVRSTFFAK